MQNPEHLVTAEENENVPPHVRVDPDLDVVVGSDSFGKSTRVKQETCKYANEPSEKIPEHEL